MIDGDHEIHGGIELPLSLELYYEEKDKQVSKGVFEVDGGLAKNHEATAIDETNQTQAGFEGRYRLVIASSSHDEAERSRNFGALPAGENRRRA